MEPFARTTKPTNHLDIYKAQMYVQDVNDTTVCSYFPATLKEIAQNGLPNGSIASFLQLAEFFNTNFSK